MKRKRQTKVDAAYVALFKYLFEVRLAEFHDPKIAFCKAISESARAEIKRPELLDRLTKSLKDGGISLPGRRTRTMIKSSVRRMKYSRRYVKRLDAEDAS